MNKYLVILFLSFSIISCSTAREQLFKNNDYPTEYNYEYFKIKDKDNIGNLVETNKNGKIVKANERASKLPYEYNNVYIAEIDIEKDYESLSHAKTVLNSFFDFDQNLYFNENERINNENIKSISLVKYKNLNFKGILNMSNGITEFSDNMGYIYENSKYIDKIGRGFQNVSYIYLTNILHDYNYKNNDVLKIKSIGNSSRAKTKTSNFSNKILETFQVMSPEMQKLARSESIMVKNIFKEEDKNKIENTFYVNSLNNIAGKDKEGNTYYEVIFGNRNSEKSDTRPFALRGMTVSAVGALIEREIKQEKEIKKLKIGSSFAAPRVTRLAYEIKKKYPFLSYQQIKQTILTTAKRDESGYLSNITGWGIVDYEKALKGPSAFNKGLIDEQKFFLGNPSKIYDKEGNTYFYVDIPHGYTYSFDNDIEGNIKGDPDNKEYEIIAMKGIRYKGDNKEASIYKYKIPKVLDSEKLFYDKNGYGAGLRKDGNGTLILNGEQKYGSKSQILAGTLILDNNSNSNYEVFDNANLIIGNNKKNIKLYNISTSGITHFKANTIMDTYIADNNSYTYLYDKYSIVANEFKINGKIKVNVSEDFYKHNKNFLKIKKHSNNDIENIKINNLYLSLKVLDESEYYRIELEENINKFKNLKDLTEEELRNIPSYSINEHRFFKYYNDKKYIHRYHYVKLFNLASDDKEKLKQEIFTDMYSSFAANLLEGYSIKNNNDSGIINKKINKDNNFFFNTYINTNIFKGKNYNSFTQITNINTIGYRHKFNEIYNLGIRASKGIQYLKFDNANIFENDIYTISVNNVINNNDIIINNDINLGYNDTKISRTLNEEIISNKLNSLLLNINTNIGKEYELKEIKSKIIPMIGYKFTVLKIFENKKEESDIKLQIKDTTIYKNDINVSLTFNTNINNILKMTNNISASFNIFNDKVLLNANILDIDTKLKGKDLDKYNINYFINLNIKINDNLNIDINGNIDNNIKSGIGATINYEY